MKAWIANNGKPLSDGKTERLEKRQKTHNGHIWNRDPKAQKWIK